VCGIEDIITKSRVEETVNILRGIRREKKWKPKLRKFRAWDHWYDVLCKEKRS
jgi:hypothetical protein